jgi:hypothetical protein
MVAAGKHTSTNSVYPAKKAKVNSRTPRPLSLFVYAFLPQKEKFLGISPAPFIKEKAPLSRRFDSWLALFSPPPGGR